MDGWIGEEKEGGREEGKERGGAIIDDHPQPSHEQVRSNA